MKTYDVVYSISGTVCVTVEAESMEEALHKAEAGEHSPPFDEEWEYRDIEEISEEDP